jgi:PIN domain nuclease of toxin-antitoxin system
MFKKIYKNYKIIFFNLNAINILTKIEFNNINFYYLRKKTYAFKITLFIRKCIALPINTKINILTLEGNIRI